MASQVVQNSAANAARLMASRIMRMEPFPGPSTIEERYSRLPLIRGFCTFIVSKRYILTESCIQI
jgi:hypothetical protein